MLLVHRIPSKTRLLTLFQCTKFFQLGSINYTTMNTELDTTSEYNIAKEGKAEILFPSSKNVFYNPVQEFNRDLSIAVIREFTRNYFQSGKTLIKKRIKSEEKLEEINLEAGKHYEDGVTILEALAASGLRSIRYALEIPGVKSIVANDIVPQAIESIKRNCKFNKVDHLVKANQDDAVMVMMKNRKYIDHFHIVDLDPYGSAAPFLDAAVQCVADGGLLLVTCTDVAILCGNASETCFAKYGSVSLKSKCCHELALRIVLYSIQSHATRYGRYIEPVLSMSVDFYVRVIVRVYISPSKAKLSASKNAMVYQCTGCETFTLQRMGKATPHDNGKNFKFSPETGPVVPQNCPYCNHRHKVGGPIWADALHDKNFLERVLTSIEQNSQDFQTSKRMTGVLSLMLEELSDAPLYYTLEGLFSILHSTPPKMILFRSALLNAGYQVSDSHANKSSIKTNAPKSVIWDIVRAWAKMAGIGKKGSSDEDVGQKIMSAPSSIDICWDIHAQATPESKEKGLVRYQHNPEPNWGPKSKSTTNLQPSEEIGKKKQKQGKRRKRDDDERNLKLYECKRFKEGKCDLGDSCKYSHVEIKQETL